MKTLLLVLILPISYITNIYAQTQAIGPAEKRLTDSLCGCITHLDQSKLHTKKDATDAFTDCFGKQSDILVDVAKEKNLSMEDNAAMHDLGVEIGKNLLNEKCPGFMPLALKMAQKEDGGTGSVEGRFKRVDNKGFNYIVVVDENNQERSFLWFRQFKGSENFMNGNDAYQGKNLKIEYQEIEVYLPQAKGYYKVKEITGITIL